MTDQLALEQFNADIPDWGKASPNRGRTYADHAIALATLYPPPSFLPIDAFIDWVVERGLIQRPKTKNKHSYEWRGFSDQLQVIRKAINRAAKHPRMHETPYPPYIIRSYDKKTKYQIQEIAEAIKQREEHRVIHLFAQAKERNVRELMQAEDWSMVDPWVKIEVQSYFSDISSLVKQIGRANRDMEEKTAKLVARLQHEMARQIGVNDGHSKKSRKKLPA